MQLEQLPPMDAADGAAKIEVVSAVKVYFAYQGRNAWWSTWAEHFYPGCLHTDWQSASGYCESRRNQGTVFYIDELPAIAFRWNRRALLIVDLNEDVPLSGFDLQRLGDVTSVLPVETWSLGQVVHAMSSEGALWIPRSRRKSKPLLMHCSNSLNLTPLGDEEVLSISRSSSSGPRYFMRWQKRPSSRRCDEVRRIVDGFI